MIRIMVASWKRDRPRKEYEESFQDYGLNWYDYFNHHLIIYLKAMLTLCVNHTSIKRSTGGGKDHLTSLENKNAVRHYPACQKANPFPTIHLLSRKET